VIGSLTTGTEFKEKGILLKLRVGGPACELMVKAFNITWYLRDWEGGGGFIQKSILSAILRGGLTNLDGGQAGVCCWGGGGGTHPATEGGGPEIVSHSQKGSSRAPSP